MVREAAVVSVLTGSGRHPNANAAMRFTVRPSSRWRDCANSSHSPRARRTHQIDPLLTFKMAL
jgi:hypothetical protein